MFWYRDQEHTDEDRVLDNIKSMGDNFTYEDMRVSLEETLHITSSKSVSAWLKKLIKQERSLRLNAEFMRKIEQILSIWLIEPTLRKGKVGKVV